MVIKLCQQVSGSVLVGGSITKYFDSKNFLRISPEDLSQVIEGLEYRRNLLLGPSSSLIHT